MLNRKIQKSVHHLLIALGKAYKYVIINANLTLLVTYSLYFSFI